MHTYNGMPIDEWVIISAILLSLFITYVLICIYLDDRKHKKFLKQFYKQQDIKNNRQ